VEQEILVEEGLAPFDSLKEREADSYDALLGLGLAEQVAVGGEGVVLCAQAEGMRVVANLKKYGLIINRKWRRKEKMSTMSSGEGSGGV